MVDNLMKNSKTNFAKNRKWNKKGVLEYFLENAFRIGFLMVALLAFFLLINMYVNNQVDTNRLESEVLANRIIYSDAIMYKDPDPSIQRTYPGILDMKKFKDPNSLDSSIEYSIKRHATAKLELMDNTDGKIYLTNYLNKEQYDNLKVLMGSSGKGSATEYTKYYPVTYKDDNELPRYGTIKMSIIIPNS